MLGIGDLGNRYPRALSGGEAQRVALARALAPDPAAPAARRAVRRRSTRRRALRLRRDVRAPAADDGHARDPGHARSHRSARDGRHRRRGHRRARAAGRPVSDVFSRPADAEVAASLGIEAVLPARVAGSSDGLIEVAVGDVTAARRRARDRSRPAPPSTRASAPKTSRSKRARRGQASTRNHLAARVVSIASEGPIDRVTLDCGFALDALITRRSRDELHLTPGADGHRRDQGDVDPPRAEDLGSES